MAGMVQEKPTKTFTRKTTEN